VSLQTRRTVAYFDPGAMPIRDLCRAGIGQIVAIQFDVPARYIHRAASTLAGNGIRDAVVDHQLLLPLALSMSRVNRVQYLLHFVVTDS